MLRFTNLQKLHQSHPWHHLRHFSSSTKFVQIARTYQEIEDTAGRIAKLQLLQQ